MAFFMKEGVGSVRDSALADAGQSTAVNYLYASLPVLPLVLLVISSKQVALIPYVSMPTRPCFSARWPESP